LAVIGPGQFGHLTSDTLQTNISRWDNWTASQTTQALKKSKRGTDQKLIQPTLRIFSKILLRLAPRIWHMP